MTDKRPNLLRQYHLLITRARGGFEWQIRYNRHASPVKRSEILHTTQAEAAAEGEVALAEVKAEAARDLP